MTAYNQAKMRGDVLAMCVQANHVSAAYRDAPDTGDAEAWKAKEAEDCRVARNMLAPDLKESDHTRR